MLSESDLGFGVSSDDLWVQTFTSRFAPSYRLLLRYLFTSVASGLSLAADDDDNHDVGVPNGVQVASGSCVVLSRLMMWECQALMMICSWFPTHCLEPQDAQSYTLLTDEAPLSPSPPSSSSPDPSGFNAYRGQVSLVFFVLLCLWW